MADVGVDQGYAAWLKGESLSLSMSSPDAAMWGTRGLSSSAPSPFATQGGATAEAQRRVDFLRGPLVRDRAVVGGERRDLIGACVTIVAAAPGYDGAGANVFVVGAAEQDNNTTILTILRKLS